MHTGARPSREYIVTRWMWTDNWLNLHNSQSNCTSKRTVDNTCSHWRRRGWRRPEHDNFLNAAHLTKAHVRQAVERPMAIILWNPPPRATSVRNKSYSRRCLRVFIFMQQRPAFSEMGMTAKHLDCVRSNSI